MSFPGIYGHESVKQRLIKAMETDRIPSAYLFSGESGIGKSSMVRQFAQMLNCETHDICHRCTNCLMFDEKAHPDFKIIEPSGQFIRISQIQELNEFLSLKPAYAAKRVVLVKESERMNVESANSFLKILEEPPLDTLIVLLASDEQLLMETILSRCQRIPFSPLERETLKQIIKENFNVEGKELDFVLNYSGGRIRKRFIDQVTALNTMRRQVLSMLTSLRLEQMVQHSALLEQWVKKEMHEYALEFCAAWLKDFIHLKREKPEQMTNRDLINEIDPNQAPGTPEQLTDAFDLTIETEKAIRANAGKVLAMDGLLIQLKQVFQGVPVI